MREQSINRGCMARLGCLLPASMASWAGSGPKGWHSRSAGAGLVPGSGLPKRPEPSLPASNPRLPSTPLHSPPQLLPSFSRRVDVMTTCCTGAPSAHFSISISTSQNRILISMKLTHVMLEVHAANSSSFSSSPGRQFGPVDRFQRVGDRVSDSPSCALSYRLPVSLTKSAGDGRMRGFTVRMGTGAASSKTMAHIWRIGVKTWGDSQPFSQGGQ
jgi:hypothetical protein